ncbi:MAG TPA: hypothetical protein VFS11_01060 [Gemmatimonadales bacterium]|nr:hypothetical protein [Gemmatimonadales bacterium]
MHWLRAELQALTRDPEFVRGVLLAVAWQNLEEGLAAEAQVEAMLRRRYGLLLRRFVFIP